jgi:hypothetical protein
VYEEVAVYLENVSEAIEQEINAALGSVEQQLHDALRPRSRYLGEALDEAVFEDEYAASDFPARLRILLPLLPHASSDAASVAAPGPRGGGVMD